jgi:parvulin-like peptidyl-prolyl isomerase
MKLLIAVLAPLAAIGAAQTLPGGAPKLAPDTVIATVDGKKVTYGEVERYIRGLPAQLQQNALQNRKQFIQQYGLMLRLNAMAEKANLDQKSPYKETLESTRMQILTQAQVSEIFDNFPITIQDQQKYYNDNKSRFEQVKLKVIYIPFSPKSASAPADGKKHLTEDEARAKAEQLLKEIRGGADFVKLVQENSEDATSKAKDGDFGTFSRSDSLPDPIRSAVFALKPGEVSAPMRQPNGFYIFRSESLTQKPFSEVVGDITTELKNARLREWLETTTKSIDVKYDNEPFFSGPAAPIAPAQAPRK